MAQLTENTMINVKNRSSSIVVYRIPELNLRREFAPGEVKKITYGELEKLTYQPGGRELLEHYLQNFDEVVNNNLNVRRESEYYMSEAHVDSLLIEGSMEAFLDALDFAPLGVIELIKTRSVQLPLLDLNKRKALKEKTGFDLERALIHIEEEKMAEQNNNSNKNSQEKPQRRVQASGRRSSVNYKEDALPPKNIPTYNVTKMG